MHEHSAKAQLARPAEILSALLLKYGPGALRSNLDLASADEDVRFCDVKLGQVSRSFAAVIRQLPADVILDIMVFYLVLRALDTIEDDMDAFKGHEGDKIAHLRAFGGKYLGDGAWSMAGVGAGAELELLQGFGAVSRVFNKLPTASKEVIRDITCKMGSGMAEAVTADMGQGTATLAVYADYCHAVAGLVGEGLTQIYVARGFESADLCGQGEQVWTFCKSAEESKGMTLGLANSMGLFLQKTNIIRDYLEDYADGRAFWPQQVWRQFATTSELGEFARPTAHGAGSAAYPSAFDAECDPEGAAVVGKGVNHQGLSCLNFLVADALELVPDCLAYLGLLKTPEVFRFSAIPQVMAIATLAECFDNPRVFTGVVKIRKGAAAQMILDSAGMRGVHASFYQYALAMQERCPADDPSRDKILAATTRILELTHEAAASKRRADSLRLGAVGALTAAGLGALVALRRS